MRTPEMPDIPTPTIDRTRYARVASPLALARSTAHFFDGELHMLPGMQLPLRSMLIDAPGSRILISPVGTPEERHALGTEPLDALVAPSLLHGVHMQRVQRRHRPTAVWGPPGYAAKHPELGDVHTFGEHAWPFADALDFEVVAGARKRQEVVFLHRATRTIYTADLVFNLATPRGLLAPLAYRALGIYGRLAMMKMWRFWIDDRSAFKRSLQRILAWDFDRIAMAHGSIVETDGRARLEQALRERGVL